MKREIFCFSFFLACLMLGSGCGSGTGSPEDSGSPDILKNITESDRLNRSGKSHALPSGEKSALPARPDTLTVNIARAGSVLPPGTFRVWITFDEVSVYKGGQGWIYLPLKQDPHPFELSTLPLGTSIALTDPSELPPGKYSRIRVGIREAEMKVLNSKQKMGIPNYSLKTEMDVEFEIGTENPINLVAVLNLRQSIQQAGGAYKLFPTFYAIDDRKAATLHGSIHRETFGRGSGSHSRRKIWVVVYRDMDGNRRPSFDEEIARLRVRKKTDSSFFKINWLSPKENYIIIVEADGRVIYSELVKTQNLAEGSVFWLNKGEPM